MRGLCLLVCIILLGLPASALARVEAFDCAVVTEIPPEQCLALVALYDSTSGATWTNSTNWLVTNTPSDWYGVTVEAGVVTRLGLPENGLSGSLPPELGDLVNLTGLYLEHNLLTGSIPHEIGSLTGLRDLHLYDNQLTGSLPDEIGSLTNLYILLLSRNQFSGSLPAWLGSLSNLTTLYLNNNLFEGSIPTELSTLPNLQILLLHSNQLTGDIPPELSNLTNLKRLTLAYNQLSGNIPSQLGSLGSLEYLDLSANLLSGEIPGELGSLTNLTGLSLNANGLDGEIPPALGGLMKLNLLSLADNQLEGGIPAALGELDLLDYLDLSGNMLNGAIPVVLGDLSRLWYLDLSNNALSGSIPSELGNLSSLYNLYLDHNLLSGNVPNSLANLTYLADPGSYGGDGLALDYNWLDVPDGYPNLENELHVFLLQKDPDWHLHQALEAVVGVDGGLISGLGGQFSLAIPAGALEADTTFTLLPLPDLTPAPAGQLFVGPRFDLTAADALGAVTEFNQPLTVTITYFEPDVFGFPEELFGLYYWDNNAWQDAVTTCAVGEIERDPGSNSFSLPLCHLSEFATLGNPGVYYYLPLIMR